MGPLRGFRIIEIAGIGPGQLAGMLLADMGASVVRIERPDSGDAGLPVDARFNILNRSRPTINVDLKSPAGQQLVLDLCADADALFEGNRPGVMERIGLGPVECMARNPKLVYGRMTGWGQVGPLANTIGHDANFIALAGVYASIGEAGGDPVYPMNLVGDMGGGGAYLVIGMLAAMLEASGSGQGQVVDAAMLDGAVSQMSMLWSLRAAGLWQDQRGRNLLDGGAPFCRAYRTSDKRHIAIAPIENRFYRNLLDTLGITDIDPSRQYDPSQWDRVQQRFQTLFMTKTREEWCAVFAGTDTCFTPVLELSEVVSHPHNVARKTFINVNGIPQPAPAPRFTRTPSEIGRAAGPAETDLRQVLKAWGARDATFSAFSSTRRA